MRIAVIGGGMTGLTAAYKLSAQGHEVTVFEKEPFAGGLANGFKEKNWDWSLEKSYHHLFSNDHSIIELIRKLGLSDKLIIKRPITANLLPDRQIAQLDSPLHLLRFPGLTMTDKLRTGALATFCKLYPFWQTLEGVTAKEFFIRFGGKKAWEIIWEPLMTGKFGHYDSTIAASWLWARVHKRTPNLCYIEGGFATLVDALVSAISKNNGNIFLNSSITTIGKGAGNSYMVSWGKQKQLFDKILFTTPTPVAQLFLSGISDTRYAPPPLVPHLTAQTLILETKKPILRGVYWLSVTDRTYPFLAVVAHTNFMDKKHYGNRHITYIGNYLPDNHPYLKMNAKQLYELFLPFIKKLNPNFNQQSTINYQQFTAYFAQPVHQLHYSTRAPRLLTGIPNIYLANMDSICPWDRGTNYAVELGEKAAALLSSPTRFAEASARRA